MANAQSGGPGGRRGGGRGDAKPPRSRTQAFVYWTAVAAVWGLIFTVGFLAVFATGLPDTSKLYQVQRTPSISYLDRSGALVAVRGSQNTPPVNLDDLPPYVPDAFIAIEDRRFYHHFGFDPIGMVRMVFVGPARPPLRPRAPPPSPSSWPATCSLARTRPSAARPKS